MALVEVVMGQQTAPVVAGRVGATCGMENRRALQEPPVSSSTAWRKRLLRRGVPRARSGRRR